MHLCVDCGPVTVNATLFWDADAIYSDSLSLSLSTLSSGLPLLPQPPSLLFQSRRQAVESEMYAEGKKRKTRLLTLHLQP